MAGKQYGWQVETGSPNQFDAANDASLRGDIAYAAEMVRNSKDKAPRFVCKTKHGWGSCVALHHMLAGTFYIEVYADGTHSDVKQVPPYRVSASERDIREGRAELYRDPISGPNISGIYEGSKRYVLKGSV
jgi:hypothetical protein